MIREFAMCAGLNMQSRLLATVLAFIGVFIMDAAYSQTQADLREVASSKTVIKVNDTTITRAEFDVIFKGAVRWKYYHGEVPEKELAEFQRQVAQDIVEQHITYPEAIRRGIKPDSERIKRGTDDYVKKYAAEGLSEETKNNLLSRQRQQLERRDVLVKLEQQIKSEIVPSQEEVKKFYQNHPERFTDPPQIRVASILLKVDPSAGGDVWEQTHNDALALVEQLKAGKDFAVIAKEKSDDKSAEMGGDMGYLHQGMLGANAETAIASIQPGEITEPLIMLEGVSVFKLLDRIHSTQRSFDEVSERARGLVKREMQERAWKEFKQGLKSKASIFIDESQFMPIPKEGDGVRIKVGNVNTPSG